MTTPTRSTQRVVALRVSIVNKMAHDVTRKRFRIPDKEEISLKIETKDAKNTKQLTKNAVKCFRNFLDESNENVQFENMAKVKLDEMLQNFYCGARTTNGELFKKTALQNIRYGLNRHTKEVMNVDIIKDPEFRPSGEVFCAVSVDLKRKGLGKIDHHPPISDNDLKKLYSSETMVFNTNTPCELQKRHGLKSCCTCAEGAAKIYEP
jgi:hypothetical protein